MNFYSQAIGALSMSEGVNDIIACVTEYQRRKIRRLCSTKLIDGLDNWSFNAEISDSSVVSMVCSELWQIELEEVKFVFYDGS